MMKSNMGIFNEEGGEMSFAILARYVLGDSVKDNFEHMNKVFSLLPVFRDIKNDVQTDNNIQGSLSWRHQVKLDSDEVEAAGVFFKATIRNIVQRRHTSYDGSAASMKNFACAQNHQVSGTVIPVLMSVTAIQVHVTALLRKVGADMNRFYVFPYSDLFPDARPAPDQRNAQWEPIESDPENDDDDQDALVDTDQEDKNDEEEDDDKGEGDEENEDTQDDVDDDDDDGHKYDTPPRPSPVRIEDPQWSQVSGSNNVVGPRRRTQTTHFSNSKRRIEWQDPK
jgi:hypothetical protein